MADITVLRTTKIGNGFVKEDVMQYLNELNARMADLVAENERLKKENDMLRNKSGNTGFVSGYTMPSPVSDCNNAVDLNFARQNITRYLETITSSVNVMQEFIDKYLQY